MLTWRKNNFLILHICCTILNCGLETRTYFAKSEMKQVSWFVTANFQLFKSRKFFFLFIWKVLDLWWSDSFIGSFFAVGFFEGMTTMAWHDPLVGWTTKEFLRLGYVMLGQSTDFSVRIRWKCQNHGLSLDQKWQRKDFQSFETAEK